jgi:hypothetical protein
VSRLHGRPVARLFDGVNEVGVADACLRHQRRPTGRPAWHMHICYTGNGLQSFGHVRRTTGAGHAADFEFDFLVT